MYGYFLIFFSLEEWWPRGRANQERSRRIRQLLWRGKKIIWHGQFSKAAPSAAFCSELYFRKKIKEHFSSCGFTCNFLFLLPGILPLDWKKKF